MTSLDLALRVSEGRRDLATLPIRAGWQLYDDQNPGKAAYGVLKVDFRRSSGTLEHRQKTTPLAGLTRISPTRFGARYNTELFRGLFDADLEQDRGLQVLFKGNPTGFKCAGTPLESAIHWIAADFQGSYDIAGAALAVMNANPGIQWTNAGKGFSQAKTVDELFDLRAMCCFEFVHFAAYLAGQQRTIRGAVPRVSGDGVSVYTSQRWKKWNWFSSIPRNKVVVGVARLGNNTNGYFHVGISLGDGRIISLGQGSDIHIQSAAVVFPQGLYQEVRVADYSWMGAQSDPGAPPTPPY
jgi:hypothetical protein